MPHEIVVDPIDLNAVAARAASPLAGAITTFLGVVRDNSLGRKVRYLPKSLRFFLRSTGATASGGGATAASYLLFAPPFCDELIALGYKDTLWNREKVLSFFQASGEEAI